MAKYCKLTGVNLDEEKSPIKKMCLNCDCLIEESDTYRCGNKTVNEKGRAAVLAAIPEGFEVDEISLKPYLLKDPTKKCSNYVISSNLADYIATILQ